MNYLLKNHKKKYCKILFFKANPKTCFKLIFLTKKFKRKEKHCYIFETLMLSKILIEVFPIYF
jgi:hypothetical protein